MKPQLLGVRSIPWSDESSGQKTVEFETATGAAFTCFVDGGVVHQGELVTVIDFFCLDVDALGDELFAENLDQQRGVTQIDEWDVEIKGQVVDIEGDTAMVDCGGVIFPLEHFTSDRTAIGAWVGTTLRRLEAGVKRSSSTGYRT